jgi:hypothetical protein
MRRRRSGTDRKPVPQNFLAHIRAAASRYSRLGVSILPLMSDIDSSIGNIGDVIGALSPSNEANACHTKGRAE